MKDDFPGKNKTFFYLAFLLIALITLYPMFFTGWASADDLRNYLSIRNGQVMRDASWIARLAGRFFYLITIPVYSLPYIVDNWAVVKLFHFIPLILCFLLFGRIIIKMTGVQEYTWFFLLLAMMTVQLSANTSLFITYPFYFTFSFALLLISFLFLLQYLERGKIRNLVFSTVFYAAGLIFSEVYVLYLLFAALTILYYNFGEKNGAWQKTRRSILQFLPFLAVGIAYITAYFIFRIYHPSEYAGTSFDPKGADPWDFFRVLWYLSVSAYPMTIFNTLYTLFIDKSELVTGYQPVILNILLAARVEWLVKGVLVSAAGFLLLMNIPSLRWRSMLAGMILCILLIFIPHLPLALTTKYLFHASKGTMLGYVTTFYSFFGAMLLFTLAAGGLMSLFRFSRVVKTVVSALLTAGFFVISVLTDFSNYAVAKDICSANLRFKAVDELLISEEWKEVPLNSPFYGKTMWDNPSYIANGVTEQGFNWYEYFMAKSGRYNPVAEEDSVFLDYAKRVPEPPWFIALRQAEKTDDIVLVAAPLQPLKQSDSVVDHYADHAIILYYSPYKTFTVSFRVKADTTNGKSPIRVNHIGADIYAPVKTVQFTIYNTVKTETVTVFRVYYPGIDLNTVIVSNMWDRKNPIFYL